MDFNRAFRLYMSQKLSADSIRNYSDVVIVGDVE
jgi:hypothetical protein